MVCVDQLTGLRTVEPLRCLTNMPQRNVSVHFTASAGLRRVLLMLQHQAHSRNSPTATDKKSRKVFSILVVISLVGTISGKSLKLSPPNVIF